MTRRRFFLCVGMALWLVAATVPRAWADDPNRLTQLKISVWPEYDTATVLVMFDGTLADTSNVPREISVLIPSSASLLVTTWENADGSLAAEQPSKSTNQGDGFTRVTYSVRTPKFHVEYYDDLLRGAPDKTMDFVFQALTSADQVLLEIQQPLKATNFSVTPTTATTRTDNVGFKYFIRSPLTLTAGQTITAQVKYTKSDPKPSAQSLPTPPLSATAPTTTTAAPSAWDNLFIIVALATVGLVAVLGFFILRQHSLGVSPTAMATPRARSRRSTRRAGPSATVFCTQCGRALGSEDNFCPRCGAKRRIVQ